MNGIYQTEVSDLENWLDNFNPTDEVRIEDNSLVGYSSKLKKKCAIEINTVADGDCMEEECPT